MKKVFWPAFLALSTAFGYWAVFNPWFHQGIGAQLLIAYCGIQPLGGFWMIYMSIRLEKRPVPYIMLAFVPYSFLWYYMERVRLAAPHSNTPS